MNVYSIVPSQRSHATDLRHELEDDPEERPDHRADEQHRRERVLLGRRQVLDARAMNTIVSVFAIVQTMNATSQRK